MGTDLDSWMLEKKILDSSQSLNGKISWSDERISERRTG